MRKIIATTIGVTIAIITLAAVLMPILSDAVETEDTFKNNGLGSYKYITGDDTYSLIWYYQTPDKVTVNDVEIDCVSGNNLVAMGDFCVRIFGNSTGYAQFILANNESGVTANVSDSKNLTITYSSGSLTVTNGTTTKTISVDGFYGIVPDNDDKATHTMKNSTDAAYMKADTELAVMGVTSVGSQWNTGYMVEGTITNYTVSQWTGSTSYTPTDITDDSAAVNGHKDLYTIKQFQWIIDNNGTPTTVTYNYFLIPKEITAERNVHLDPASIGILAAIPIIIIAAILMLAVTIIARNRD